MRLSGKVYKAAELFPTMKPMDAKDKPAPKAERKLDLSKVEIEPLFTDYVDFETFSKSDFRAVKIKECFAVPKSKKLLQFTLNDGSGVDRTILSGIHEWYERRISWKNCRSDHQSSSQNNDGC